MSDPDLLQPFQNFLAERTPKTSRSYVRTVREFMDWNAAQAGQPFTLSLITAPVIEAYLQVLQHQGYAPGTRRKTFAILKVFCRWAMSEGLLLEDPTSPALRPITPPTSQELTAEQRRIVKRLVEQAESARLTALFALAYWGGLRVSDIATLRLGQCEINQRDGAISLIDPTTTLTRRLELHSRARLALYRYLYETSDTAPDVRDKSSAYVFTSQRAAWLRSQERPDHLSARGIEHLWVSMKMQASVSEWKLIQPIHFRNLRHDFMCRVRAAGWTAREIALYTGHTQETLPTLLTSSPPDFRAKLAALKG